MYLYEKMYTLILSISIVPCTVKWFCFCFCFVFNQESTTWDLVSSPVDLSYMLFMYATKNKERLFWVVSVPVQWKNFCHGEKEVPMWMMDFSQYCVGTITDDRWKKKCRKKPKTLLWGTRSDKMFTPCQTPVLPFQTVLL